MTGRITKTYSAGTPKLQNAKPGTTAAKPAPAGAKDEFTAKAKPAATADAGRGAERVSADAAERRALAIDKRTGAKPTTAGDQASTGAGSVGRVPTDIGTKVGPPKSEEQRAAEAARTQLEFAQLRSGRDALQGSSIGRRLTRATDEDDVTLRYVIVSDERFAEEQAADSTERFNELSEQSAAIYVPRGALGDDTEVAAIIAGQLQRVRAHHEPTDDNSTLINDWHQVEVDGIDNPDAVAVVADVANARIVEADVRSELAGSLSSDDEAIFDAVADEVQGIDFEDGIFDETREALTDVPARDIPTRDIPTRPTPVPPRPTPPARPEPAPAPAPTQQEQVPTRGPR